MPGDGQRRYQVVPWDFWHQALRGEGDYPELPHLAHSCCQTGRKQGSLDAADKAFPGCPDSNAVLQGVCLPCCTSFTSCGLVTDFPNGMQKSWVHLCTHNQAQEMMGESSLEKLFSTLGGCCHGNADGLGGLTAVSVAAF